MDTPGLRVPRAAACSDGGVGEARSNDPCSAEACLECPLCSLRKTSGRSGVGVGEDAMSIGDARLRSPSLLAIEKSLAGGEATMNSGEGDLSLAAVDPLDFSGSVLSLGRGLLRCSHRSLRATASAAADGEAGAAAHRSPRPFSFLGDTSKFSCWAFSISCRNLTFSLNSDVPATLSRFGGRLRSTHPRLREESSGGDGGVANGFKTTLNSLGIRMHVSMMTTDAVFVFLVKKSSDRKQLFRPFSGTRSELCLSCLVR